MNKFQDKVVAFDVECFCNYFLVVFYSENKEIQWFEAHEDEPFTEEDVSEIKDILHAVRILTGYNSQHYDVPMLLRALTMPSVNDLYEFSDRIISNRFVDPTTREAVKAFEQVLSHVDTMACVPGFVNLKLSSARLHCDTIENLPYQPDKVLTAEEKDHVRTYCIQDCENTMSVYDFIKPALDIRRTLKEVYDIDCINMHNAQICEKIICKEAAIAPQHGENLNFKKKFNYRAPKNLKFNNRYLREHHEKYETAPFEVKSETVKQKIITHSNYFRQKSIPMFGVDWNIGIGGVHTDDKKGRIDARERDYRIINMDVGSYYPAIIMNENLGPEVEDKRIKFLHVYKAIFERRMKAKADGDKATANALKIPLNAVTGKLNNKYSVVYSPESYIRMTLTGQLLIVKLAEMIFEGGGRIYSANTDGLVIVISPNKMSMVKSVADRWQKMFGCTLDLEEYKAVYSRDVNNYFALPADENEKVKRKGTFSLIGGDGLWPNNPQARVCADAVIHAAGVGRNPEKNIETYIRECVNLDYFFFVGTSTKGVKYGTWEIGKVFRFIWTIDGEPLYRNTEQVYLIPNSASCKPVMRKGEDTFSDLKDKIDYTRYIKRALEMWDDCGGNMECL